MAADLPKIWREIVHVGRNGKSPAMGGQKTGVSRHMEGDWQVCVMEWHYYRLTDSGDDCTRNTKILSKK